jgi:serine/threonine-protein kinase
MALSAGTRLGPYEILAPLGAGGMGEVYRATDTKLGREVAIKTLPPEVTGDSERLARFQREAHLLASLNHPHIAAIYGFEEADGKPFLVLELVEGENLQQRLERGAIPVDETLEIAKQMAEGLEAAHEKGIVHRDLKPANVKLTPDGKVKVLDFGLAKAWAGDSVTGSSSDLSQSPTLAHSGTQAGVILGTAAYMSPSQARGKPVDKRADIWAFGVVLFEMLTGQRLFSGDEVSDTLASILKDEPNWTLLPADTPHRLSDLLRRSLRKDARNRLRDIGDARIELEETIAGGRDEARADSPSMPPSVSQRGLPWTIAGAAILALGLVIVLWTPWRRPWTPSPLHLDTRLGPDLAFDPGALSYGPAAILAPDETHLAFVARKPGEASKLYVRPLDQLETRPLPGTEGARSPFFSPDGQWIGFFAGGKLQKIAVEGGAAVTLATASDDRGGSWGEDGTIVLTPQSSSGVGLQRVSSAGGEIQTLTIPDPGAGEVTHRWPQVLGDGRVLYTAHSVTGGYDDASLVIEAFPEGPRKVVHRGGYHGRYLPSGHLVFIHQGTLFAAPFDLERMEVSGSPVPVIEGVRVSSYTAGAQFSFSDTGTLMYVAGEDVRGFPIHWLSRGGMTTTPLREGPASNPRFSPDGDRLALQIHDGTQLDIWIYQWSRDTLTRLTFDPADDAAPVWSPDGRHLVFSSSRGENGIPNLYWRPSDGSGEAGRLTESENHQYASSWHPSGRFLAFTGPGPQTGRDVKILEMEGDEASVWAPGAQTTFAGGPFTEGHAAFSPDGRFVAYESTESGRREVYVRPFPGPGGKWQVSTDGAHWPTWSKSRPELLYATEGREIMVASYTAEGDSFRVARPAPWSDLRFVWLGAGARGFDLHPDGERVALRLDVDESGAAPDSVVLITNFFDELRRLTGSW